ISLGITTLLYLGVSVVAVLATPLPELQGSEAPLADVVRRRGPGWAMTVSLIGLLAGINGALVQIIMASRVMYGMGRDGISFSWLGVAHPYTRTPVRATIFASMLVLVLALSLDIAALAGITDRKSTRLNSSHVKISYAVFCLKKKKRAEHEHHF